MNTTEHLLQKLSEECAEVQKVISKALLFGLHEGHPKSDMTNEEELYHELNDMLGTIEFLNEKNIINFIPDTTKIKNKKSKIKKYMNYARKKGTLK